MKQEDLGKIIITLNSEHASMLYFLLEAHEGICFYSTLDTAEAGLKSIELLFHPTTKDQVEHLLASIQSQQLFNFHRD